MHEQILIGKRADLAMFGVRVESLLNALALERKTFYCITEKRRGKLRHKKLNSEILVVYTVPSNSQSHETLYYSFIRLYFLE